MTLLPLEKNVVKVSHSEAEQRTLCERRHYYGYGMQQEPKGSALSEVLYRGIVLDYALNDYFRAWQQGKSAAECLSVLITSIVGHMDQDGKEDRVIIANLMARMQWWHEVHAPEIARWQIIAVQKDFPITISDSAGTEIRAVALPDLVARIPGKGICVIDYKSVRDFYPEVMYEMGKQLPLYLAAVRLEMPVAYVGYMEIRHRNMQSKDPKDYFKLDLRRVGPARIVQTLHEHKVVAEEISLLRAFRDAGQLNQWERDAVRTINKHVCNYCPFFDLCTAELRGDDTELMLESLYRQRQRRKELVVNDA